MSVQINDKVEISAVKLTLLLEEAIERYCGKLRDLDPENPFAIAPDPMEVARDIAVEFFEERKEKLETLEGQKNLMKSLVHDDESINRGFCQKVGCEDCLLGNEQSKCTYGECREYAFAQAWKDK